MTTTKLITTKISLFMNYLLFKIKNYVIFITAKIKTNVILFVNPIAIRNKAKKQSLVNRQAAHLVTLRHPVCQYQNHRSTDARFTTEIHSGEF